MFFIVIPLSGSIITEKKEGSFMRLRTLPVTAYLVLSPKVIIYILVCLVQFLMMLAAGIWLFPGLFGFPPLQLGDHYIAIFIATLASAFAASGFGLLVGTGSQSHSQAALSGSILVVIIGVISGTFFPIYLLPKGIQVISMASPMRWGIDNYLELFIREGDLISILPNLFLLLSFFVFAMTISIAIFARQK
jgi:ABC-2 type transport system permease protein